MNREITCCHDLHVHTNLSFCAPRTTTAESYLELCAEDGIRRIGFTNHIYTPEQLGVADPGHLHYALKIREELAAADRYPVQVLVGCEVETFYGQPPGLKPEAAAAFDYVLLAASHIFNQMHAYSHMDLSTPDKVRELLLEQFRRACMLPYELPTGICHPLYPVCCPFEQEVVDGITDSQLKECFSLAAERHRSIEIHACLFRPSTALDADGLSPSYLRILAAAKACGCRFHFGSDVHAPEGFAAAHRKLELAARKLGITEADLWSVAQDPL